MAEDAQLPLGVDEIEVGIFPTGERLVKPFEVSNGTVLAPGAAVIRSSAIRPHA